MTMNSATATEICQEILKGLDVRTQDIIVRRFGLSNPEPAQTLESIGQTHGITRERVRQIISFGLQEARSQAEQRSQELMIDEILSHVGNTLEKHGHVKREDLLLKEAGAEEHAPYVLFLLHIGEGFHKKRQTEDHHPYWTANEELCVHVPTLLKLAKSELEKKKSMLTHEELADLLEQKKYPEGITLETFLSALETSKHLMQGYDGRWGLRHWPEVNLRGVREKAYLVLQQSGEPMHFRDIAERIDSLQKEFGKKSSKPVLPQTVHNELIKDDRFVLVGRGIYGLADHGYIKGTVKEVIAAILKANRNGLSRDDILRKVAEQRLLKESTVLLNLQDRSLFKKDQEGRYYLV